MLPRQRSAFNHVAATRAFSSERRSPDSLNGLPFQKLLSVASRSADLSLLPAAACALTAPISERARFGIRSRLASNASAASFGLPACSSISPSSSCDGLIGSAAPFGGRIVSSIAAASFNIVTA